MKTFFLPSWLRYMGVLTLTALLAACGASSSEVAKLPDPNAVPITAPQRVISARAYTYQADPKATNVT